MRSFLSGSLERITSGNLAESSYSFCFTMNYPKIHRSRSTRVAALTAVKTNSRKEVSESFNVPIPTLDRWKREAQDAGTMGDGLGLARPAPRKIRSDAGQRKKVTPRMINTIKIPASPAMTFVPQYQDLMKFPEGLWMTSFSRTWSFLLVLLWRSLSWLLLKLLRLILYTHIYFRPWAMKKKWHFSFLYNFTNIQSIWTCDTTIRRRISRAFHWWYWICHLIKYWQRYLHSKSNYHLSPPPLYIYNTTRHQV